MVKHYGQALSKHWFVRGLEQRSRGIERRGGQQGLQGRSVDVQGIISDASPKRVGRLWVLLEKRTGSEQRSRGIERRGGQQGLQGRSVDVQGIISDASPKRVGR